MEITDLKKVIKPAFNRLLKKTYIPEPTTHLYIEPTNLCNLKCKFCAYPKVTYKKQALPMSMFEKTINMATDYGFNNFGLTPITGEVFADKTIQEKFQFLESHPKVQSFSFYSNFIPASPEKIDLLLKLKKLARMSISLYGHDFKSFSLLTGGGRRQYDRLVKNIAYLFDQRKESNFDLEIALRSTKDFDRENASSSLWDVVEKFGDSVSLTGITEYDNWGGLITEKDLVGIDVDLISKPVKKIGACALIFYKNQVHSDGKVNACACRDVTRSMEIGDLNTQTFFEIYSIKNKKLMGLIEAQQRGEFSQICHNCSFYRSIYSKYDVYEQKGFKLTDLKGYIGSLKK